jgi:hypothetical protein
MAGPTRDETPPFRLLLLALVAIILVEPSVADRVGATLAVRLSAVGLTVPLVVIGLMGTGRWKRRPIVVATVVLLLNGGGLARLSFLPPQIGLAAALAFLLWATNRVFRSVVRASAITTNLIAGALAAYLMIALAWALAYGAAEVTWPGSIHVTAPGGGAAAVDVHTLMYFSAITIMTIGYGDVTPAFPFARTLAMLEGLAGIVFTTVVLGALVGTLIGSAPRGGGGQHR